MVPLFLFALASVQDVPLLRSTFAEGEDGWSVVQIAGTGAKVEAVHDAAQVKVGTGSLRLAYVVGVGTVAGATRPIPPGAAAKMGSIRFWVRAEADAPIVVSLQQKGGAQYASMTTVAKGRWQEVEVGVQDLVPNPTADTPDASPRLNPAEIESVTVLDLNGLLAQAGPIADLLGISKGPHALLLSDFRIVTDPLRDNDATVGSEYLLDAYLRPQPAWMALNGSLVVGSEAPLNAPALRFDENLPGGKVAALGKPIKPGTLYAKKTLTLRLASTNMRNLIVQLEERGGGKYNANIDVPGGSTPVDRVIPLATMTPSEDSKDANGKLDVDEAKQLTIVDITAAAGTGGANTLWVGKVAAKG